MTEERRQHPRIQQPFEGSWSGASGATSCRIGDLSLGGCFIQSLASPNAGETTTVTINFGGDHAMSFKGTVVYAEDAMGFAVKFNPLGDRDRATFNQVLAALAKND
ncbi:MAG: PilZ domain-containing protein [Vicinamibacterales bacterium]